VSDSDGAAELAVLHTLGHLCFATTEHLHALCFLGAASSTVRLRLAALRARGCIELTPWRLPRVCLERGSLWTLTATGCAYLAAYGVEVDCLGERDLGVPSTALERDEWRVRMVARSLVVRLIVRARLRPTFADGRIRLRSCWPTPYAPPPIDGDAELAIRWTPAAKHNASWLPWQSVTPLDGPVTRYVVHVDRPLVADAGGEGERADDCWWDGQGRACALRPDAEEARAYHAPTTA